MNEYQNIVKVIAFVVSQPKKKITSDYKWHVYDKVQSN